MEYLIKGLWQVQEDTTDIIPCIKGLVHEYVAASKPQVVDFSQKNIEIGEQDCK